MMTSLSLKLCLWVMLGGALGAVSRYILSLFIDQQMVKNPFSLGMLVCNILGCLALGWVSAWLSTKAENASEASVAFLGAFLISGFLASFTTFSTWINTGSKLALIEDLVWLKVISYFAISVFLGLVALVFGSKCYFWFK